MGGCGCNHGHDQGNIKQIISNAINQLERNIQVLMTIVKDKANGELEYVERLEADIKSNLDQLKILKSE